MGHTKFLTSNHNVAKRPDKYYLRHLTTMSLCDPTNLITITYNGLAKRATGPIYNKFGPVATRRFAHNVASRPQCRFAVPDGMATRKKLTSCLITRNHFPPVLLFLPLGSLCEPFTLLFLSFPLRNLIPWSLRDIPFIQWLTNLCLVASRHSLYQMTN